MSANIKEIDEIKTFISSEKTPTSEGVEYGSKADAHSITSTAMTYLNVYGKKGIQGEKKAYEKV